MFKYLNVINTFVDINIKQFFHELMSRNGAKGVYKSLYLIPHGNYLIIDG